MGRINRKFYLGIIILIHVGHIALLYLFWNQIPSEVPTHFNWKGEADSFGSANSMLILPVISMVLSVVLYSVSFYPNSFNFPVQINEENQERQYRLAIHLLLRLNVILSLLFFSISAEVLTHHLPEWRILFWLNPVFLLMIFLIMIDYFIKAVKK